MSPRQGKWSLSRAHNSTVKGNARRSIFQSSLEDRLRYGAPGQVSWLSDRPTPRAFPASRPVALSGFVPHFLKGVSAAYSPPPLGPLGAPGADSFSANKRPQIAIGPTDGNPRH